MQHQLPGYSNIVGDLPLSLWFVKVFGSLNLMILEITVSLRVCPLCCAELVSNFIVEVQ